MKNKIISPNYYNYYFLDQKKINNFLLKEKKLGDNFRILIHKSPKEKLHQMLIYHSKNHLVKPHSNQNDKSFNILRGKCSIIIYDKNLNQIKKIDLNKNKFFLFLKKNTIHTIKVQSRSVLFIETTVGPHIKTKFYEK